MNPQRPSRTAEGAAFLRAWHACVDEAPLLVEDPEVRALLDPRLRVLLQPLPRFARAALRARERWRPESAALRGQIVVRSRYAEDALDAALAAGVDQLVVLGAGLDTLAMRRPEVGESLHVYEVDHPATQAWKRERLGHGAEAGVSFVPVEFGRDGLDHALVAAGLDTERPVFVNWLGVTYYLTPTAIGDTLGRLRRIAAPGSAVVLDFWTSEAASLRARALLFAVRWAVALQEEPMHGLMSPTELEALAGERSWRIAEHLGPEDQRRRWLADRRDTLAIPGFAHLARLEPLADPPG